MITRHPLARIITLIVVAGTQAVATAFASGNPPINWIQQFGTTGTDLGVSVAADGPWAYVVGSTTGALTSADGQPQANTGGRDAFIRKYDSAGHEIWTREFGSAGNDSVTYVAVDHLGGVYVVGTGAAPFGGQTEAGAFVRKYDVAGNVVWTREFNALTSPPSIAAKAHANAVACDGASGDVYVVGQTDSGASLPGEVSSGGRDGFVRKYDSAGNVAWTHQFVLSAVPANSVIVIARAAATDSIAGGVYVGGYFQEFASSTTTPTTAFLRKYSAAGIEQWTTRFGTPDGTFEDDASSDPLTGDVYVGGVVEMGDALPGQTSSGGEDAFVRKYGPDGSELWTRQFGTDKDDSVLGVSADSFGRGVYAGGRTFGGAFPGFTTTDTTNADAFVRSYSADGAEQWTQQFGSPDLEEQRGVGSYGGDVYLAGDTAGTLPGQTSAGGTDAYLAKITVPDTTPPTISSVVATPDVLWPTNHKMVAVSIAVVVTDLEDPSPTCAITNVTSNEPTGRLDKDKDAAAPDWQVTGALTLNLRAERAGRGNGLVYTITVTCTDASGNAASRTTTVLVPHDMRPPRPVRPPDDDSR